MLNKRLIPGSELFAAASQNEFICPELVKNLQNEKEKKTS